MRNSNISKVLEVIQPIYRQVLEEPDLVLTPEMSANDVDTWDSLNHITLVVEIELFSGVQLSVDELVELKNVGDFAELLINKGYSP